MSAATARLLDTARVGWTMAGVLAVIIFLAVLATAGGIAIASAGAALRTSLTGQVTVQIVTGDAELRARRAAQVVAALRRSSSVSRVVQVPRAELSRLLGPWLGNEAGEEDLPVPALIDVTLVPGGCSAAQLRQMLLPIDPAVRVDAQGEALAGTGMLLQAVIGLAIATVALMVGASVGMVLLSIRAGLAAHESTIEVMHRLGATDAQVARLFCRRMVRDASLAAATGAPLAWGTIVLLGRIGAGIGAELLGGMTLGRAGWGCTMILPVAFVALAALVSYVAVRRALRRLI